MNINNELSKATVNLTKGTQKSSKINIKLTRAERESVKLNCI